MKNKIFILLILFSLLTLFACKDDKENKKENDKESSDTDISDTDDESVFHIKYMVPDDISKPGSYPNSFNLTCSNGKIVLRRLMLSEGLGTLHLWDDKTYNGFKNLRELIKQTDYGGYLGLYSAPIGGVECFDNEGNMTGPRTHNDVYYMRFKLPVCEITYEGIDDPSKYGLPSEVVYGEDIDVTHLPVIEKEDFTFLGWKTCKWTHPAIVTNSEGKIIEKYFKNTTSDMRFEPEYVYTPKYDIAITIDYNDGTYRRDTLEFKSKKSLSNDYLLKHYKDQYSDREIIGWSLDPEGKERFDKISPDKDTTVYAVWERFRYICVFNGVSNVKFLQVRENSPLTLYVPTREGYEFCGWFDNETFSGIPISGTISFSDTHEFYYALWKEVN